MPDLSPAAHMTAARHAFMADINRKYPRSERMQGEAYEQLADIGEIVQDMLNKERQRLIEFFFERNFDSMLATLKSSIQHTARDLLADGPPNAIQLANLDRWSQKFADYAANYHEMQKVQEHKQTIHDRDQTTAGRRIIGPIGEEYRGRSRVRRGSPGVTPGNEDEVESPASGEKTAGVQPAPSGKRTRSQAGSDYEEDIPTREIKRIRVRRILASRTGSPTRLTPPPATPPSTPLAVLEDSSPPAAAAAAVEGHSTRATSVASSEADKENFQPVEHDASATVQHHQQLDEPVSPQTVVRTPVDFSTPVYSPITELRTAASPTHPPASPASAQLEAPTSPLLEKKATVNAASSIDTRRRSSENWSDDGSQTSSIHSQKSSRRSEKKKSRPDVLSPRPGRYKILKSEPITMHLRREQFLGSTVGTPYIGGNGKGKAGKKERGVEGGKVVEVGSVGEGSERGEEDQSTGDEGGGFGFEIRGSIGILGVRT